MKKLISHNDSPQSIEVVIQELTHQIIERGDKPNATIETQLKLIEQLSQFEFGQYWLRNRGINGFWTHYMLTHPWFGRKTGKNNRGDPVEGLEDFILNRSPLMLATQQRFEIFLKENQKKVKNNAILACIPSGVMGDFLYLDYKGIENVELIAIDYDPEALEGTLSFSEKQGLSQYVKLIQADAWELEFENAFDLISSNGLNIYEPDQQRLDELYLHFFRALKKGGKLVTSFLTLPPTLTEDCEWDMSKINQEDLGLQKLIFVDILDMKFRSYQSSAQVRSQLEAIGYQDIQFIYDEAKLFPTVVAYK